MTVRPDLQQEIGELQDRGFIAQLPTGCWKAINHTNARKFTHRSAKEPVGVVSAGG